jgi:AraC family transcriptional regulator of adaptative response / DNA-3-methyladenine glycosylase II
MQRLDPRVCYRALATHDERFDGRLFVGVTSTGIYCRPVCPASPARFENCRFFASAAAAQEAGFRPCLRCRPETAPDGPGWRGSSSTVSRGLALIADGELDGDQAGVDGLAERLGIGARQLRRLFQRHLGASPIAVAQTRRVLFAKRLIHETRLPMTEVATAAGFGSLRRFNETFQQLFDRPPSALRRRGVASLPEGSLADRGVTVHLRYRPPFDWAGLLAHLGARALARVEWVEPDRYRRTIREGDDAGIIEVIHRGERRDLAITIRFPQVRALPAIIARVRQLFDLGADVVAIGAHLARDPLLAPLVAARPGLRVPGGWDGFEVAARTLLCQQIALPAGRRLADQLIELAGPALTIGAPEDRRDARPHAPTEAGARLDRLFPTPAEVAAADLTALRMPRARQQALRELARAALADPRLFHPQATVDETTARLGALCGVGDWTAHTIALRAAREPDAFPAGDAGLLRGAARRVGRRLDSAELGRRAQRWRPWRGYAAQHLWAADAAAAATNGEAP